MSRVIKMSTPKPKQASLPKTAALTKAQAEHKAWLNLDFSSASWSGWWTRLSAGILVMCTIGFAGYRTRFAERASDNIRLPVMRVDQGARQHAEARSLMFSVRPVIQAELKAR